MDIKLSVGEMILSNWAKALGASHDREMAAKEKKEAESKKVQDAKVEAAKNASAYKKDHREAAKAVKAGNIW